ncbi:MAG TPA: DsbA family protein [Symbiobacteriaceae bacterium]|nr:DsbA family protein [Symbiobacteriaceae bacterium]
MAKVPLARVGQSENIELLWLPFELRPEGSEPIDLNAPYIQRSMKEQVIPRAEELGLVMKQPTFAPNTRLAHEAQQYAVTMGKGWEMGEALFKAYWSDQRDIGQVTVLCDIGLSVGLDPVELRGALEGHAFLETVLQGEAWAAQVGISAVPSAIVGRKYLLQGFRPEEDVRRAIQLCREGE